jgi:hypothetical protein
MREKLESKNFPESLLPLIELIERQLIENGMHDFQQQLRSEPQGTSSVSLDPNVLVNVIPSNPSAVNLCCALALAIAHGSSGVGGLCQVIQQLRSHLICCADSRNGLSTKTVLIIYDKEDQRVFWESKRDFKTHRLVNGVSFFRFYWDGRRLIEKAMI